MSKVSIKLQARSVHSPGWLCIQTYSKQIRYLRSSSSPPTSVQILTITLKCWIPVSPNRIWDHLKAHCHLNPKPVKIFGHFWGPQCIFLFYLLCILLKRPLSDSSYTSEITFNLFSLPSGPLTPLNKVAIFCSVCTSVLLRVGGSQCSVWCH